MISLLDVCISSIGGTFKGECALVPVQARAAILCAQGMVVSDMGLTPGCLQGAVSRGRVGGEKQREVQQ